MNMLFDGLHLYEIVLFLLGVVLFVVLVVTLLSLITQRRRITPLLPFFILPLIMIGVPLASKVKFDKDGIELEKITLTVARNAVDDAAKTTLRRLISSVQARATQTETLVKLARAEAVLGNLSEASEMLDRALNHDPDLTTAKDLKARLKVLPSENESAAARRAVEANVALKPRE
jgi:tetratricopeptide (TPR) repeat protein